ncbi:hypothetical protein VM98_38460, partial [Streptomyces rubellomurinus subsp. indigoferus]
ADGAHYLGLDGRLLVPTTARPLPAADLWRSAPGAADGQLFALVPGHGLVADVPPPLTVPDALAALLGGAASAAADASPPRAAPGPPSSRGPAR